jgi:hypothetical protein
MALHCRIVLAIGKFRFGQHGLSGLHGQVFIFDLDGGVIPSTIFEEFGEFVNGEQSVLNKNLASVKEVRRNLVED